MQIISDYYSKRKYLESIDLFLYKIWYNLWFQNVNNFLCCLIPTPNLLHLILRLILVILTSPLGIPVYFIWFFVFSKLIRTQAFRLSSSANSCRITSQKINYEILTANVCLLPEALCRINNLYLVDERLNAIGNYLTNTDIKSNRNENYLSSVDQVENNFEHFLFLINLILIIIALAITM